MNIRATSVLILINIIVYLIFLFGFNSNEKDFLNLMAFDSNEYPTYTSITYMFTHVSLWNLFFNTFIFFSVSGPIESEYGSYNTAIYALLIGFISVFSNYLLPIESLVIGFSGVTWGFIAIFCFTYREKITSILYGILLFFEIIQLIFVVVFKFPSNVSNITHIFGFGIGALIYFLEKK